MSELKSNIPEGPLKDKWTKHKNDINLVNPANKRNIDVIVVGTGLAGGSAAATLAELGYNVKTFCYQDSPRRAHSIAAQGGINAAKNYQGDGDSNYRLFYDTVKGGDYRSREANVYRLAEVSANIIDQCVAQGVPFAREYGGLLDNRSFGGVLVSRTFYAKGQTGQQLLLGAYSAMNRQINRGKIEAFNRHEMLDLVLVDGKARGIIARDLVTGEIERHSAHAVVLASGGYGNVFFLSTNAMGSNVMAAWRAHRRGAYFANPCYTQIHPTCIPVSGDHQSKLTLMSESLRNDGRIWVPKKKEDAEAIRAGKLKPTDLKEEDRDYYLERRYPAFGNLVPRDVASRAAKERCDAGFGVNKTGEAVYLDFKSAIMRYGKEEALIHGNHNPSDKEIYDYGKKVVENKYGNLFQMYEKIVDEDPYTTPMMIYPAVHYTMGGLWVDYNLQTTIPGCYAAGEANFSDHGANRLGASALMQGLADGYFVLPYTIGDYLSKDIRTGKIPTDSPEFDQAEKDVRDRMTKLMNGSGKHSVDYYHKKLGKIMWNKCGMARNAKELQEAMDEIAELRADFWENVKVPGSLDSKNAELEKAGRVADFLELGELFAKDALTRNESCGGHFREEYQTPEGEALRDDENFSFVSAWEYNDNPREAKLHKEQLTFENIEVKTRSYK
ncbi:MULTISPECIES: fumarate reductase/succinate dehydrogenase flavoprotein subunit [Leeuwenhoekiella]|jgi:succinate dehydrogenase / fumarate reductase flavoprotein subunit|uniref:succinate dehydrogenase n=1 Tax=Leeuwenhoekiella blandensis (strain CECT 7118 / CCUG 51940 / KCTC 22103 / MED217) TaxID=398720 RepID=A3XQB6_LEEBM|nr:MULTISPECIES: fumarate reductase/succinate dehydrogenase flavoprotein subunit [Leeuwenhoekiella]EAQ48259.1 succinate dehydrogenase [Leeuwenhoekiella blandensis MED217]MAO43958.1 succinate dehydrogenase flavoprotein subunit [Leeuwenhoekiella sp.]HBT09560.1 fumarate reductase/succinate dehydrogenase flavoprotein subunit [Leeuwenhoekiella sp.]HCW64673.1 fumarate reductase/succinate dehydrogenase flavoprotein subunit [Leeuwenhoekiella sp.]|tara:strand:+ start:184114 stop:186117 length:2004 start_codon:yes stop_codon:yes gene_type:complete